MKVCNIHNEETMTAEYDQETFSLSVEAQTCEIAINK